MCSQLVITLQLLGTSPRISDNHQWARKRIWSLITRSGLHAWLVQTIIHTKISTCLWFHLRGRTRDPSRRPLAAEEADILLSNISSSSHSQQGSTPNSLLGTFCPALSLTLMLLRIIMEMPEWIILVASLMWDPQRTSNNSSSCPTTLRDLGNPTITTIPMRWGIRKAREANGVYKNRKVALLVGKDLKSKGKWHLAVVRREERARVTRKIC